MRKRLKVLTAKNKNNRFFSRLSLRSLLSQNGYPSRRRSLVDDARFETLMVKQTKQSVLEEARDKANGEFNKHFSRLCLISLLFYYLIGLFPFFSVRLRSLEEFKVEDVQNEIPQNFEPESQEDGIYLISTFFRWICF